MRVAGEGALMARAGNRPEGRKCACRILQSHGLGEGHGAVIGTVDQEDVTGCDASDRAFRGDDSEVYAIAQAQGECEAGMQRVTCKEGIGVRICGVRNYRRDFRCVRHRHERTRATEAPADHSDPACRTSMRECILYRTLHITRFTYAICTWRAIGITVSTQVKHEHRISLLPEATSYVEMGSAVLVSPMYEYNGATCRRVW